MRKSTKAATSQGIVKELHPKDPDGNLKFTGTEPMFALQPENHAVALAKGFTWYNMFFGTKDAKRFLAEYLDSVNRTSDAKMVRKADDVDVRPTYGWLARMTMRGLLLSEHEEATLNNEISRLIRTVTNPESRLVSQTGGRRAKVETAPAAPRPSIQDLMKEKASEAAGELEGMFDEFIKQGAKAQHSFKPIEEVVKRNILTQHINIIDNIWKAKFDEFSEVLQGRDSQLVEGYGQFTKTQIKNIIKFIEQVQSDLNGYVSIKKATKTPRAKKAVPVEKIVSKLKYLKEFKDKANKLDLVSISPVKLHGASEAWVYDTAKRKLHHYVADAHSKYFTVKGNTLLGFDTVTSEVKSLRKPAEQLKEIMSGKPAARKFFKDIKAVSTTPNGRFNDSMVILKAF